MKFGSLFTGIGGFDLGFRYSGIECAWQCEIDKFASEILRKHYRNIDNLGDVRNVGKDTESVDLICGGFPCQDLSVAGKRTGLAGVRSGLWFEFHRVIKELQPRWVVIENVPGLLSSNEGKDMGILLGGLAELGYGWAYRVLDAQYFGVAQRRRRVFIVGYLGNPRYPAKVLFEPESGTRNNPPSRKARHETSGTITARAGKSGAAANGQLTKLVTPAIVSNGDANSGFRDEQGLIVSVSHPLRSKGNLAHRADMDTLIAFQQNLRDEVRWFGGDGTIKGVLSTQPGMKQQTFLAPVAYSFEPGITAREGKESRISEEITSTLRAGMGDNQPAILWQNKTGVRRLTPVECERLQGFPDGWTDGQSDTQRYKQLGNAVAVPCAEWIGKKIMEVEKC